MKLIAIFGPGRSGTTWLGSIVASSPEVAYRFESFHRLRAEPRIARARRDLEAGRPALDELYRALLPSTPVSDKPPFFRKRYAARLDWGRRLLWPLARCSSRLARLYTWLYTPLDAPPLAFKEVSLEPLLAGLVDRPEVRLVYLLRHPAAVVGSLLAGQAAGLMRADRRAFLGPILAEHDPALAARLAPRLDALSPAEREALLWRVDVERGVRRVRPASNGLVVFYEELVADPHAVTSRLFAHLGLELGAATRRFLARSTRGAGRWWWRIASGELGPSGYFSVFRGRDTRDQRGGGLPPDQRRRVIEAVADSEVYTWGVELGHWKELA